MQGSRDIRLPRIKQRKDYFKLLSRNKKHVPGPTSDFLLLGVINLRAIAELIAKLISLFRHLVIERQ